MIIDKLTQLGWEDAADYFHERDTKYGKSELMVLAIVQPQTDGNDLAPAPTTFGEHMECPEIFPAIAPIPQGTSRPGNSQMMLGLMKPPWNTSISSLEPALERDTSHVLKAKPDEPVSVYRCI